MYRHLDHWTVRFKRLALLLQLVDAQPRLVHDMLCGLRHPVQQDSGACVHALAFGKMYLSVRCLALSTRGAVLPLRVCLDGSQSQTFWNAE